MANRGYGYQYETSPRKLEPDYRSLREKQKKTNSPKPKQEKKKTIKSNVKKKYKMSFEMKFFLNSMLFFSIIFAIIACQALVEQRYKERESLKQEYNELLSKSNMACELNNDVRLLATDYGMQTKSATLIDLGTSDYIESSVEQDKSEESFWAKIINWWKEIF